MPDPTHNPKLRAAIAAARKENMPKDNVDRAIKKALGGDAENYEEVRYEGYGPGGVAIIVEALTDNRNRTGPDVRSYFSKFGGQIGTENSVAFLFNRVGSIVYPMSKGSADDMLEKARLESLGYQSPVELLGEKFHTSPRVLAHLNKDKAFDRAGESILEHKDGIFEGIVTIQVG